MDCTEADRKTPRQTERKSRNTDTKTAYTETDRQKEQKHRHAEIIQRDGQTERVET